MKTTEFYIEVRDGHPIKLTKKDGPPPSDVADQYAYWALSTVATGDYPSVLIHVYTRGRLPSDEDRYRINAAIKDYIRQLFAKRE